MRSSTGMGLSSEPEAASPGPETLSVRGLSVEFSTRRGTVRAVDGVDWSVRRGETLALVGESGSGKSVTALAVLGLLPRGPARVTGGRVLFEGRDLLAMPEAELRALRGRDVAMVFQDPMTSLNPVLTIGRQLREPLVTHLGMTDAQADARAVELLGLVGIPDAARRLNQYPHQFSGGMRQRVMIAMALACDPKLLIADEPTTALDVTVQAQILELMKDLSRRLGITLVVITHNLGIVARYADRVAVMYAGRIVEEGPAERIFASPRHPYTAGLLRAVPRLDRARDRRLATIEGQPPDLRSPPPGCRFAARCPARAERCAEEPPAVEGPEGSRVFCHFPDTATAARTAEAVPVAAPVAAPSAPARPLLEVRSLSKIYEGPRRSFFGPKLPIRAVDDVSFSIGRGETLGLVGESGSGKTTVGRLVLHLDRETGGSIVFDGLDLAAARSAEMRDVRRRMQVIFQDPYTSLDPRMTVGGTISEPLTARLGMNAAAARARTAELLDQVGLVRDMADRYPHQLSGGQRQRVGIARALAMEPELIVCDEPVSALDVSIQGQIINLLEKLQEERGIAFLFIAHDLAVVRHLSHRIVVMYLGRVMETADRDALYAAPMHPYTRAMLDAAPIPDPAIERRRSARALVGELPSPLDPPSGCVFRTRCPVAEPACAETRPPLVERRPGHFVACIKPHEAAPC